MRIPGTRYLAVLLPLFAVGTTSAFTPGPGIIRECSKCKAHLEEHTTMSGNTFGARIWTDGKMLAPMMPDWPWLVKCPKCGSLFWIDEAKKLGEQNPGDKQKKWPNAKRPNLPTEADFFSVLSAGKLPKEKELYARRCVWWAANDAGRTNESATVSFSPAEEANLHAMIILLNEKDSDQRITKAEILRELRKFNDCVKLLTQPFENRRHAEVAAFIKKLAEQKLWRVREIK